MMALARSALPLVLLAAATGPASAAPASPLAVPLPPPPPGTVLRSPSAAHTFVFAGKAGMSSPLGNGGEAGPMLQAEVAMPWRTTPSGVALGWALPLRTVFLGGTEKAGLESGGTALELTPTFRASVPLGRSRFSFRTEAGLGVVARWTWAEVDVRFLGRRTETSQSTTGIGRMGLALDWEIKPRLSLAVEPVSLGFDFEGNADWTFAAGATYRL